MQTINVMVNGLPGNMAAETARWVAKTAGMRLVPYALTGPNAKDTSVKIESTVVKLVSPANRDQILPLLKSLGSPYDNPSDGQLICVDYTHPNAANENADFYCNNALHFVMGTTGGDRNKMADAVKESKVAAVIAPNMAKQIVAFQAMMEFAAQTFPNVFEGYTLEIKESHQKGKADTSGTAKALVDCFNKLGVPFAKDEIIMERDPEVQKTKWGIPESHISGHGWHTYTLRSKTGTVMFQFTHNVNGRDVYALGTLDAICYLANKVAQGAKGQVFSMIDVLKGV